MIDERQRRCERPTICQVSQSDSLSEYLSRSLRQLPADGCDIPGVCGEPLLTVIQSTALCGLLDQQPQTRHCTFRHRLHLPKQNGHPQDDRS